MTEKRASSEQAPESTTDVESFDTKEREGGSAAWLTVLGSTLIYYSSFGLLNSFGFFQDYYTRDFLKDTPIATIAFIGTLQMALMNLLAAVAGSLCDRHGVKYLYLGSGSGTFVALLVLSCIQPGQFWETFLVQGFFMGATIAFGVQPALTVAAQHFKKRRALAMSLVATGSALGGMGYPLMFGQLVPRVGFANALRLAALKTGLCYAIALYLSKSKSIKHGHRESWYSLLDFKGFLDLRYTILCIGAFFAILGLYMPSYYIKTYANAVYPGNSCSEYFLLFINGSNIVGAVFGGFVGDRIGRLNLLWPMTFLAGLLSLFLWLLNGSVAVLVLFTCLYGFSSASISSLPPSIIGQITPDESVGGRIGAFYSLIAVASLVGTPIGGALITNMEIKGGYESLIIFSGCALISGSMFMLGSRVLHDSDLRKRW